MIVKIINFVSSMLKVKMIGGFLWFSLGISGV